jgi:hypothetical protein
VLYAVTKLDSVDVHSLCVCAVCGRMSLSSVVCVCVCARHNMHGATIKKNCLSVFNIISCFGLVVYCIEFPFCLRSAGFSAQMYYPSSLSGRCCNASYSRLDTVSTLQRVSFNCIITYALET